MMRLWETDPTSGLYKITIQRLYRLALYTNNELTSTAQPLGYGNDVWTMKTLESSVGIRLEIA